MKAYKTKRTDGKLVELIVQRMKELRQERGYSQEYVIEHTSLDISRLETGASIVSLVSLTVLCRFYGITLREFFARIDYPEQ